MRILRENTAALLIDVQDRLLPVVAGADDVVRLTARLIQGLRVLDVPVVPVRQYPKGLGDLAQPVREALGEHSPSDKITFSAWDTPQIVERVRALEKTTLLVFGMETHVCVLQTVVDFLGDGYDVVVATDCVSSRRLSDHETALRRIQAEGAVLTTSESILFELLRAAGTDTFKQISTLVR